MRVRLFNRRTGQALGYANLIDTLCHELAHVEAWEKDSEGQDHGPEWQRAFRRIQGWAASEDIFDPSPDR